MIKPYPECGKDPFENPMCRPESKLIEALITIREECRLHAEGPHDKTGNMLSIGMWAAKALEGRE